MHSEVKQIPDPKAKFYLKTWGLKSRKMQNTFFLSQTINSEKLTTFINTINGKDGNLCHLVTVPPGPLLSDALISSPILQGEDGAGPGMEYASEYGFDPNSDPELALVSGSKRLSGLSVTRDLNNMDNLLTLLQES